jgi:hypothetical protein
VCAAKKERKEGTEKLKFNAAWKMYFFHFGYQFFSDEL